MTAVADATQLIFFGGGTNGKGFLSKDKVSSVAPILSCISCIKGGEALSFLETRGSGA